jgi:hypothetical protein
MISRDQLQIHSFGKIATSLAAAYASDTLTLFGSTVLALSIATGSYATIDAPCAVKAEIMVLFKHFTHVVSI